MIYYDYPTFVEDIKVLAEKCREFQPDAIVAVARGGVTPAHFLATALDVRMLFSLVATHYDGTEKMEEVALYHLPTLHDVSRVLVVDEIVDTGETMEKVLAELGKAYPALSFKSAALFQKKEAVHQAHYWLKEPADWIDFFWTRDVLGAEGGD